MSTLLHRKCSSVENRDQARRSRLYIITTERTAIAAPHLLAASPLNESVVKGAQLHQPRSKSVPMITPQEMQTVLARARESAVRQERNRLAGEMHDSLAQSFTAICMQLEVAKEELSARNGDALLSIQRAVELAAFGLAEARRCVHNLRSSNEPGLPEALQWLVERSTVAGRLRCTFRPDYVLENNLSPRVQNELFRIAQEAIHNAVRHANPTEILVTLRSEQSSIILHVEDNGSGIPADRFEKSEGFGLRNMQERASAIDGRLQIQTASGQGTCIIVRVEIAANQRIND